MGGGLIDLQLRTTPLPSLCDLEGFRRRTKQYKVDGAEEGYQVRRASFLIRDRSTGRMLMQFYENHGQVLSPSLYRRFIRRIIWQVRSENIIYSYAPFLSRLTLGDSYFRTLVMKLNDMACAHDSVRLGAVVPPWREGSLPRKTSSKAAKCLGCLGVGASAAQ